MVQSLDVISVNLWQILISLANLFLLFLILKRFLFKPVKNVLDKRQSELDESYAAAKEAVATAVSPLTEGGGSTRDIRLSVALTATVGEDAHGI